MKNFKNLIKEAHLGNPLNEVDRATNVDRIFAGDIEIPEFDPEDVRADLEAEMNEGYDGEDIVIYDGEEHIIMRKDGNMVYIRPLEDSAILGKRDEIKVPARALAYKSDLDKMYDEYKPKDEMNEVDEKWDKIARDEYGKPWMELSIAQKQEMLSYANRETEKQFQTDYERRRKGDYSDDMKDGMTDYERRSMDEDINDPVLMKARAAQMADEKEMARQTALDKKYGSSFMGKLDAELDLKAELQDLKDEREQLMIDMEQEAEPEGGEIADEYGSRLNDIDTRMAEIKPELEDLRMYESVNEDLDIGHQDDEPSMLKSELARAGQMIQMLYRAVDKYDDIEGEVDFPQWWQAKIIKANTLLDSAFDYLAGEEDVARIDAMIDRIDMDESVNKKTLGDLVKTYGKDLINFVIGIDELTKDEIKDVEYLDDRIQIHLEEPEIRQKYLPEGTCGYTPDGEPRSKPAGPDLNEDEIPMYLTSNDAFKKAVEDSVSYNDFEKRVYGILGPKYFKLAKIENPGAMKDYYDSVRVTRPSMEEAFDLDIDDAHSGDAALNRTVGGMGYNESLKKSLKESLNKRLGK